MAQAVEQALTEKRHLIVEAGTGTGKTLAYLVPVIRSGKRVIISTGTKNLQEQLFYKDIPFLEQALFPHGEGKLSVCYMKGRANYLCRKKLYDLTDQPVLSGLEEIEHYRAIAAWEKATQTGDRAELAALPEASALWHKLDARAEALLFAAARAQTVASVIRPALAEGKVVICDRYVDSSLAYQGWARGLGEPDVLSLNVWATQGLFPDMVILLHIEPERGLARSDEPLDRMEQEGQQFLAKVADAYLKIAEEHPERFVVVDADREPAAVFDSVREALERAVHERDDHQPAS